MRPSPTWSRAIAAAVLSVFALGACGLVRDASRSTSPPAPPSVEEPAPEPSTEAPTGPPTIGRNAVLRPKFTTTKGPLNAGTAWVLAWPGGTYLLVTAHHLFGPDGGLDSAVSAADLPKVVTSVTATSADDKGVTITSRQVLPIAGAAAFKASSGKTPDLSTDVAAFRLSGAGGATALPLAGTPAAVGDTVFLLAQVTSSEERLFPAKVNRVIADAVQYEFDDPSLELRATSGAPVVNTRGEVIGINIAGGDGVGLANPSNRIRERIGAALGR